MVISSMTIHRDLSTQMPSKSKMDGRAITSRTQCYGTTKDDGRWLLVLIVAISITQGGETYDLSLNSKIERAGGACC